MRSPREDDLLGLESLQAVLQHWSIVFVKDVAAHMNDEIRTDPDHVGVVRGVVQRTHRQAVRDDRLAAWIRIAQDVGRLQQLSVA